MVSYWSSYVINFHGDPYYSLSGVAYETWCQYDKMLTDNVSNLLENMVPWPLFSTRLQQEQLVVSLSERNDDFLERALQIVSSTFVLSIPTNTRNIKKCNIHTLRRASHLLWIIWCWLRAMSSTYMADWISQFKIDSISLSSRGQTDYRLLDCPVQVSEKS